MLVAIVFSTLLDAVQQSPLFHEPKLAQEITARVEAETVGEFLARIGEETKTELRATPEIAEDVIILYAKAPAADILDKVAKHFDWTWEKDRESYVLKQSEAQRKQELADQEELILRPYLRWQQRAKDALQVPSGASERSRQELVSLIEQNRQHSESYQEEYFSNDAVRRTAWSNKRAELDNKSAVLARALSPTWRVVDELIAGLTKQDLLDLDRLTKTVYAAPKGVWQKPFNVKATSATRDLLARWSAGPNARDGPDREFYRQIEWPMAREDGVHDVSGLRVVLKLTILRAMPDAYSPNADATLALLGAAGSSFAQSTLNDRPPRLPRETASVQSATVRDRFDAQLPINSSLGEANEADSKGFLKRSTLQEFLSTSAKVHPARAMARLLIEASAAAGVDLISDCFESQTWSVPRPIALGTARGAFDALARTSDSKWKSDGRWVGFRTNYWQLKRLATLRPQLLYQVRDLTIKTPVTLDVIADVATLLTDRQLENTFVISTLLRDWRDAFHGSHREEVWALRFLGTLSPVVRKRMLDGEKLRYSGLSKKQKDALQTFVYLCDRSDFESELSASDTELGLDVPDIEWMRSAWPKWEEHDFRRDTEPSSQLPNGIPADAMIGLRHSVGSALEVSNGAGWSMKMTESSAIISGYYKNEDGSPYLVRPITQQRHFFTVWLTPEVTKGVTLSVYDKATGEAKPYDQQSSELRNRLERAYKIRHGG